MIKKIFGYTLAAISFISIVFFSFYNGDLISHKALWLIISAVVLISGLYISIAATTKKEIAVATEDSDHQSKLIATGEKIQVDINSCEIKENNYYEDTSNEMIPDIQSVDAIFDPNENYQEKYVDQSVIIYTHLNGNETEKYVSQIFPLGPETLTLHILNNDVTLYVDKNDRKNYLFELKAAATTLD